MKGQYLIPFCDGTPQHYPEAYKKLEWRTNEPFRATFVYTGYSRGRSSTTIHFKAVGTDIVYEMFMHDFHKIAGDMDHGSIAGEWEFVKCGQNYGVRRLEDK